MNDKATGILDARISETPFAVLDLETTGLVPGHDKILELSVYHVLPGAEPKRILETLINPLRPVAGTEIHGIIDDDVRDAPTFTEVVGDLVRSLSGCVVASYNVYFDIRFLSRELEEAGTALLPPHLCLMYLRPLLGIGPKCRLTQACSLHGISHICQHAADTDAHASAELMKVYLGKLVEADVRTFRDLAKMGTYQFLDSLTFSPFTDDLASGREPCKRLKVRHLEPLVLASPGTESVPGHLATVHYWEALRAALADLRITPQEIAQLDELRSRSSMREENVRALHARLFAWLLSEFTGDSEICARDASILHDVIRALRKLGWAPGDPVADAQPSVATGARPLAGKTIVVTGALEHFSRSDIEETIKRLGGRTVASVSKNTDFVVVGADPGSKLDKARQLGVKTITEEEFRKLIGQ